VVAKEESVIDQIHTQLATDTVKKALPWVALAWFLLK